MVKETPHLLQMMPCRIKNPLFPPFLLGVFMGKNNLAINNAATKRLQKCILQYEVSLIRTEISH